MTPAQVRRLTRRLEAVAGTIEPIQRYVIERFVKETGELIYRREVQAWQPRPR